MTENLKLAPIFRDHMVVQHGIPVHIFGEGCGEITVSLGAKTKTVQADGTWLVELEPMPAGGPHMLCVTDSSTTITVTDVMVGEVILCSGQSNMQFHMWEEVTPASEYADDDGLRIFVSGRMEQGEVILPQHGWVPAAKDNIRNWSALAYLVGRDLRRKKGCPVGVIACSQGASNIQTWIDERRYLGSALELPIEQMHADARSPKYGVWNKPGLLYHYMLEPLLPYSVGSVLWYQGESNTSDAEAAIYMDLLRMMIENWREDFRNAALPFCVVQIANFKDTAAWRGVQDAQMRAQTEIPGVTTVKCSDISENENIHPPTKWRLAARIADAMVKPLRPALIFGDHMVLQRRKPIRIFGSGTLSVTVTLNGAAVTARPDGCRWCAVLPAVEAGGPYTMTLATAEETIEYTDVMIGEVVLCSGQSNMEFHMRNEVTPRERYVSDPLLRTYMSARPIEGERFLPGNGWHPCETETVDDWYALPYLVGLGLRKKYGIAVGMIAAAQGATHIQSFIDEKILDGTALDLPMEQRAGNLFHERFRHWNRNGDIFHYTIEPVIAYTAGAVIWYQGESNAASSYEAAIYGDLLELMIADWRHRQGSELPFCVVQIANYDKAGNKAAFKAVQDAQLAAQDKIPGVHTVICADICESDDIHPPTKWRLAQRITEVL